MDRTPALFLSLALAATLPAQAGECRGALRPLLLTTTPDLQALAGVRGLCQREADAGDADSLYQLALTHLGLAGDWQPDVAIPMIRDAAAGGVPEAQYWLAWQYEAGPPLPNDQASARGWYQRAANANHRLANGRLARAYEAGELGLAPDALKATEYKAREARCLKKEREQSGG